MSTTNVHTSVSGRGRLRPESFLHTCYNRTWKADTAHKSLQQGRGLCQGDPFVCSVSDSHDSAIKAEALLTFTGIYYREKSGNKFNTNLAAITSTQVCAEKLDLLTPQERKTGLLTALASYSFSVTCLLLIASQLPFHFRSFGTSLFSRLLSKRRKARIKRKDKHLLKKGFPGSCRRPVFCETGKSQRKEWGHP